MKIRTRINLIYLLVFFTILLAVGFVIGYNSSQALRQEAYNQIVNINNARAEHLRTYLNSEKEVVSIMGASTVFRDFLKLEKSNPNYLTEKDRVQKRLTRSIASVKQILELFIVDKNGIIISSSNKENEGLDRSGDLYFLEGQKGLYIKDLYFSEIIKRLTYDVAAPINDDASGKLLGVVVARMDNINLFNIVESRVALGETGESFLINNQKYLLTPSRFLDSDVILKQKIETQNAADCFEPEEIAAATATEFGGEIVHSGHEIIKNYIDYRGQKIIGTHAYIPEASWCLITKIDESEVLAPSYRLLWIFVFIGLGALIVYLFIGYIFAKRITRPIYQLQAGMKIVEGGNLDYKVATDSVDEIGELSRSFDSLTTAVKKSRADVDRKVKEQTQEISSKAADLADQQKAVLNILEDVEEEKEKTKILAKDLEKFKLAVDNASDHIVITDAEGKILYANKGVEKITGFGVKEILGHKAGSKENWGGQMPIGVYKNLWQTIKEKKKVFVGNLNNRRKNGEKYEVIASISPVLDAENKVIFFVGIERDVTKEKQIDKAKTEFVSLASHQLRTPLSAINWYAEMLLAGDAGKINKKQKEYLDEIYHGNQRMVELVNALLNVSRLELGTFAIEPSEVNLVALADSVLNELAVQINEKNQQVDKKYDKKLPTKYGADEKLLRIVFQNLLSNAVKYTPAKGKISLSVWLEKGKIRIEVKDTGLGIPKTQQDHIFEKLFRADNVRASDTEGTGLGLYIVKAIIDAVGGKIGFNSTENKGTTFLVELPTVAWKKKEGSKTLS